MASSRDASHPSRWFPSQASKWARSSFAKLRALALAPLGFEKLVLLDTDTVACRVAAVGRNLALRSLA